MNKLQKIELDILLEIDRVCKAHGIRYHLAYGTQLGAVRHGGFIPWDDDLDIAMMREDYDRFVAVAERELATPFVLQTWTNDPYYANPFAKVRARGTLLRERFGSPKIKEQGVWVDIFPYDAVPSDLAAQKKMYRYLLLRQKLLFVKCGYTPWRQNPSLKKSAAYALLRLIAAFCTKEVLKKKIDARMRKYAYAQSDWITECADADYFAHVTLRRVAEPLTERSFEGTLLPIQQNYDDILTREYGDYMTPPATVPQSYHNVSDLDVDGYRFVHLKEEEPARG